MIRREWWQASWTWTTGRRVLRGVRQRWDEAARQSVSWKMLARIVGSVRSRRSVGRQAIGYLIVGGLCGLMGLMVFGARSLTAWDVAVRSVLLLGVVWLMIRCAESADR